MSFVENKGTKIYWDEQGQGAPVLLIMGLGYTSIMWNRIRPALALHFRTIAFDNRGVGRSDVPPGPYSIATMASDAAAVLDAAGIARAHVFGVSMGGMIAQEFALQYPARTCLLILGCTAPGGPQAVRAESKVIEVLLARGMTPEQARDAILPYIYDAATPRERIEEDIRVREPWLPTPEGYIAQVQAITNSEEILDFQQVVRMVPIADSVARYAVDLVRATRATDATSPDFVSMTETDPSLAINRTGSTRTVVPRPAGPVKLFASGRRPPQLLT